MTYNVIFCHRNDAPCRQNNFSFCRTMLYCFHITNGIVIDPKLGIFAIIDTNNLVNGLSHLHLYIHIPFCKQACHYCDFHFSTNLSAKSELVAAICKEIELQKNYLPTPNLNSIYFGGGTPSLLTESELAQIFETIHQHFVVSQLAEITLEANPDDLTDDKLRLFRNYVNRLSIGIQSFHAPYLQFMNRAHSAAEAESCVKKAQDIGFDNMSIDLMYGMVGTYSIRPDNIRPNDIWQTDLDKAVALSVPHISSYCLTIEPKTVLGNWLKNKKIAAIDDELSAQQFEMMVKCLTKNGYEHYEISNFAKPNQYAQHNSSYWQQRSYLGIGPSAHSFDSLSRQYNISNNTLYIKSLQKNELNFESEQLSPNDQANDYLLTGLRTIWGCRLAVLDDILKTNFYEIQKQYILSFVEKQWLRLDNGVMYLTPSGKLFADRIVSDLFVV
jgi:oxygen-independent coproporphyrinogen III oxidase